MQDSPEIREYRFGAYRLSNHEQSLYHNGKTLSLSTKIYYLLLALAQNAGQVMSKDELIEVVWPGQVVTDTALAKQVLRLRKLLSDQNREHPLIETHRGVGYRFTPQVEITVVDETIFPVRTVPQHTAWQRYAAFAVFMLVIFIVANQFRNSQPSNPATTDQAVSLAVLQMGGGSDWLNLGGVEYLSDLISSSNLVYTIRPQDEWFATESPDEMAVELAGYENIDYSCLLEIAQIADRYLVQASLRNKDGVLASTEISAEELPMVFEETENWIRSNLQTAEGSNSSAHQPSTRDDYALQSYLQGLQALRSQGDYQKAADYFRAAVNSDPDFSQAWSKLARSLTDLGHQTEALSIGLTLLEQSGLSEDDALNVEVHYVIARAYNRLSDGDNAAQFLRKTREVIAEASNPYVRLDGLESLGLLAGLENDIEAAEQFGLERLALAIEYYPVPNYLASIHLQLASFFEQGFQLNKLRENAEEAIRLSEAGRNSNGVIAGYRYLNSYNFALNKLDEGVQVAIQGEPYLDQSAASYDQAFFLQYSSLILNLRGMFELSEQYSSRLKALAVESNNSMYEVLSDFTVLHRLYVQEQLTEARAYAQSMRARFRSDAVMSSALPDAMLVEATVSARADELQQAIDLLDEFEQKFGSSKIRLRNELNRARGHIAVRQGNLSEGLKLLQESELAIREKMHQSVANYVGYEILQIMLKHPEIEYQSVIDRLERHTDYDYHFHKLKAQFSAREGNFLDAAILMQENQLRANQLWKPDDQLLLESYQLQADS